MLIATVVAINIYPYNRRQVLEYQRFTVTANSLIFKEKTDKCQHLSVIARQHLFVREPMRTKSLRTDWNGIPIAGPEKLGNVRLFEWDDEERTMRPTKEMAAIIAQAEEARRQRLEEEEKTMSEEQRRHRALGRALGEASRRYGDIWRRTRCLQCGAKMYRKGLGNRMELCSDACAEQRHRKQAREWAKKYRARKEYAARRCAECGEMFQAKRVDAKYCSPKCRQRARR